MSDLQTFGNRRGPVSASERAEIREWLDADWESHDVDGDAVKLIRRLLDTLEGAIAVGPS